METLSKENIALANDFGKQICEALGIDTKKTRVRRVVLDAEVDEPIKVYIELFGTERLLDLKLPTSAVEVVMSDGT